MLLQMSIKTVFILSGMMHLALGGKHSIVTVNFAIHERVFLQGLIFHWRKEFIIVLTHT